MVVGVAVGCSVEEVVRGCILLPISGLTVDLLIVNLLIIDVLVVGLLVVNVSIGWYVGNDVLSGDIANDGLSIGLYS